MSKMRDRAVMFSGSLAKFSNLFLREHIVLQITPIQYCPLNADWLKTVY